MKFNSYSIIDFKRQRNKYKKKKIKNTTRNWYLELEYCRTALTVRILTPLDLN